ncbi:repeat element protein-e2.1 [Ichnoviriform fugitivi]|uniref:Repeat element protein-e2.1 n=1 Tax=Ichnoviriform fugitivi TaxID=265522 RepID=A2Q0P0_9VIRU|nr:repeat element protein-e2.1 [Ichnoviriform fugitivi]BAF45755.1 repeat element protein-e2.1 [Ichnoviriform fugitivi]
MSSEENRTSPAVVLEEILHNQKTSWIDAMFLNGKLLEVRYYFEDKGTKELIMIDVDSLLPIFEAFHPITSGSFRSLDELSAFVQENIHFNKCSNYQYADCVCHLLQNHMDPEIAGFEMYSPSDCLLGHFHHACSSCVNLWLNEYLRVLILHRESKPLFTKAAQEIRARVYPSDDFNESSYRDCPEFYLRIAQRWTTPEYLLNDMLNTWRSLANFS